MEISKERSNKQGRLDNKICGVPVKRIILVEGIIGSGKTEILKLIEANKYTRASGQHIYENISIGVIHETVNEVTMGYAYGPSNKDSQLMFTRLCTMNMMKALEELRKHDIVFVDRSYLGQAAFAEVRCDKLDFATVWDRLMDQTFMWVHQAEVCALVYGWCLRVECICLKLPVSESIKNIKMRGRRREIMCQDMPEVQRKLTKAMEGEAWRRIMDVMKCKKLTEVEVVRCSEGNHWNLAKFLIAGKVGINIFI